MAEFLSAFLIGILGAGHCVAMCGGLTAAIGVSNNLKSNLAYNIGRITSYTLAGLALGLIGYWLTSLLFPILISLRFLSGVILILLGFYLARWYMGLTRLEKLFNRFWQFIAPLAQQSVQKNYFGAKFVAGMLWGWLPCGLVYSTLTWATSQANPISSALIMLAFGLGTMPALLFSAVISQQFKAVINHKITRALSGAILILFGLQTIYVGLLQVW